MDEVNVWLFREKEGTVTVLVSDLRKDRLWMEDEKNNSGFTPWMWLYHPEVNSFWEDYKDLPSFGGHPIFGKGRVNLDHVVSITYDRTEIKGSLSDLEGKTHRL